METITISKIEFEQMKREIFSLKNSTIYKRLLDFEKNILQKKFSRKNLGF